MKCDMHIEVNLHRTDKESEGNENGEKGSRVG